MARASPIRDKAVAFMAGKPAGTVTIAELAAAIGRGQTQATLLAKECGLAVKWLRSGRHRHVAPPRGDDVDDYAGVMLEFRDWCGKNGCNFRSEMMALARKRMTCAIDLMHGKGAPDG